MIPKNITFEEWLQWNQADALPQIRRKARRATGIARFERECRCVEFEGRRRKAWRVPGTREAGKWNMLNVATTDIIDTLKTASGFWCIYPQDPHVGGAS